MQYYTILCNIIRYYAILYDIMQYYTIGGILKEPTTPCRCEEKSPAPDPETEVETAAFLSILNNVETNYDIHKAERHADIPTVSPVDNYKLMLKRGGILAPFASSGTTPSLRDIITSKSLPFNNPHPIDFDGDFQGHSGLITNSMHNSQGAASNKYEHTYEENGNEKEEREGRNKGVYSTVKATSTMDSTQTDEPEYTTANQQQVHQDTAKNDKEGEIQQYQSGHGELNQHNKASSSVKPNDQNDNVSTYKFSNHEYADRTSSEKQLASKQDSKLNDQEMKGVKQTERYQQKIGNFENLGEHQESNHETKVSKQGDAQEEKEQPSGNKMKSEEKEQSQERKPDLSKEDLNSQGKNFNNQENNEVKHEGMMTEKEHNVSINNNGEKYTASAKYNDEDKQQNYKDNHKQVNYHVTSMNEMNNEASNVLGSGNTPTVGPHPGPKQQSQERQAKGDTLKGNPQKQQSQEFEGNSYSPTNNLPPMKENSFKGKGEDKGDQNHFLTGEGTYDNNGKNKDPKINAELYNQYVYKQELQNNKQPNEEKNEPNNRGFSKESEENSSNMNRYEGTLYKDEKEETTDKFGNVIAKQKYKGTLFLYDKGDKVENTEKEQQIGKNVPTKRQHDHEQMLVNANNENTIKGYKQEQNTWNDIEGQSRNERMNGEKFKNYDENSEKERNMSTNERNSKNEENNEKNTENVNGKENSNENKSKENGEKPVNRLEDNEKSLNEKSKGDEKSKENESKSEEQMKDTREGDKGKTKQMSQMVEEEGKEDAKQIDHEHEHVHGPHGHLHDVHHEPDEHEEREGHEGHGDEPGHMMKAKFNEENDQQRASNEEKSSNLETNKSHEKLTENENKGSAKGNESEKQGYHFDTGESRLDNKEKAKGFGKNGNEEQAKQNESNDKESRKVSQKEGEKKIDQKKEEGFKNTPENDKNNDAKWRENNEENQRQNDRMSNSEKAVLQDDKKEKENTEDERNNNDREKESYKENDKEEQNKGKENKFQGKEETNDRNKGYSEQQKSNNAQEYKGTSENNNEKEKQTVSTNNDEKKEDQRKIERVEQKLDKSQKESLKNQNSGQASIADLQENGNGYETINDIVKYPRKNLHNSKNGVDDSNLEQNSAQKLGFNDEHNQVQPTGDINDSILKQDSIAIRKVLSPEKYNVRDEKPIVKEFHSEMDQTTGDFRNVEEVKKHKKIEDDDSDDIPTERNKQSDKSINEMKSPNKNKDGTSKALKMGPKGPSVWHKPPHVTQNVIHHEGTSRDEEYTSKGPKANGRKGPSLLQLNISPNQIKNSETNGNQNRINTKNNNNQIEITNNANNTTTKQQQQQMDPEQQMLMRESEKAGKIH